MSEKIERPAYWAVIPADVRYDDKIPPNAKLLYGEISALCNAEGYCWARNEYFAQLFGFSVDTVSRLVAALRHAGYLELEMVKTPSGSERRIYAGLLAGGVRKDAEGGVGIFAEGGLCKIDGGVSAKNASLIKYNNTQEYIPPNPPGGKRARKRAPKSEPRWKPERFEGFWRFYPAQGRRDRPLAVREWDALRPDDELIAQIGRALIAWKASDEWQRGIAIPYAGRWLRKQKWLETDTLAAGGDDSPRRTVERAGDYEI